VDDKNVLHERPVETGAEDAVGIEITSGLEPGEKVVTLSYQPLKDGQSIKAGEQGKGKRGNKP
jgi:multidrug efflux pump subunit AcrA (membrane-fusion protein)